MGEFFAHRHPRCVRRCRPLIPLWLASALAAEIAVEGLPEGATVVVEGAPASHGHEARGLPAGTHTVYVYAADGERRTYKPVLVADDERVVLGPHLGERGRTAVPERIEVDPGDEPQWLHAALADRATTRIYVDDRPVAFELSSGTWDAELTPGPHEVLVTVGGRRRHRQALVVDGAPWRCGVDSFGGTTCVELTEPSTARIDIDALAERIRRAAPAERLALLDVEGQLGCADVVRIMNLFVGDADRVTVAQRLRPHVVDPGEYERVSARVSFTNSKHAIESLYRP